MEYEGDPLDQTTNQVNDDYPTIVIDEASKLTLKETIESLGLEILESVQPTGKSASSNQSNRYLEYERYPLEYEGDPLDIQVMRIETYSGANIEERDSPDTRKLNEGQQVQNQAKIEEVNDGLGRYN